MNYDVVTREYNDSCTVWKAANLMNFEDVLEQYEPMIFASLRKLNIYRDHDQFTQAGRVALWQAWRRFDAKKGNFAAYAYRSIQGAMLDELKKENRFEEQTMHLEEELVESIIDPASLSNYKWPDDLAEALAILPAAESELIHQLFIEGLTLAECAEQYGITVAGIKKRRERTLVKLRNLFV